jgi:DHA1 family tetracycline resistance protein-like MFS transporter
VLPESLHRSKRRKFDLKRANPFGAMLSLRQYPVVLWLLGSVFLFALAAQAYPSVYNYFTIEVFNFTSSQIGRSLGAFGIGFALCQAFGVGPAVKRFGEIPVVVFGMLAAAIAFIGTAFLTQSQTWLYIYLMIGALSGLAAPAINGLLSRQVPDDMQGELQGAVNAANSLATIIGPLAATQIFGYFTTAVDSPGYFPGAPFLAAGIVIAGAAVLYLYVSFRFDLQHKPSVAAHPVTPEMAPPGQIRIPGPDESSGEDDDEDELAKNGNPPRKRK